MDVLSVRLYDGVFTLRGQKVRESGARARGSGLVTLSGRLTRKTARSGRC